MTGMARIPVKPGLINIGADGLQRSCEGPFSMGGKSLCLYWTSRGKSTIWTQPYTGEIMPYGSLGLVRRLSPKHGHSSGPTFLHHGLMAKGCVRI